MGLGRLQERYEQNTRVPHFMRSAVHREVEQMGGLRRFGISLLALVLLLALPVYAQQSGLIVGGAGSGFVVGSDGYILTNEHVIRGADTITVHVGGQAYEATVVAQSVPNDLALLKIPASGLSVVRLGNSLQVEVLEEVVAMGYPRAGYGRDLTTSRGAITAIRSNAPGRAGKDTLQHDAAITHGSSGGPLLNARGEVVGVNYAGDPPLNWAIPINEAIPLLRNIPGFSTANMGTATRLMSATDIMSAYRSAVVFIDCTIVIGLGALVPDPAVIGGAGWSVSPPLPIHDHCTWWSEPGWLEEMGLSPHACYGAGASQYTGGRGIQEARIIALAFRSSEHAAQAEQLLYRSFRHPPEGDVTTLAEGAVTILGVQGRQRIVYTDTNWAGMSCKELHGRHVARIGPLVLLVDTLWRSPGEMISRYGYQDGWIVELWERMVFRPGSFLEYDMVWEVTGHVKSVGEFASDLERFALAAVARAVNVLLR